MPAQSSAGWLIRWAAACFAVSCLAAKSPAQQFSLDEARDGWSKARRLSATLQGRSEVAFQTAGGKGDSRNRALIRHCPGHYAIEWETLRPDGGLAGARLTVTNPRYGFVLHRRATNNRWIVIDLIDPPAGDSPAREDSPQAAVSRTLDEPLRVVGSPLALPEFVAEASFTLRSLTPQADDKARMTFDCQAGWLSARTVNGVALEPSWNGVRRGWIDLLPKANWVIAGYDVEYQGAPGDPNGSYFISGQHEYEMRDAPVIRRVLYQARKRQELGSPLISSHEATYQLQPGAPSQSEFTLSHFGFEEPSWVEASFRPSTAIIGSILLAFGICGAALLLWRRRRLTRAA